MTDTMGFDWKLRNIASNDDDNDDDRNHWDNDDSGEYGDDCGEYCGEYGDDRGDKYDGISVSTCILNNLSRKRGEFINNLKV